MFALKLILSLCSKTCLISSDLGKNYFILTSIAENELVIFRLSVPLLLTCQSNCSWITFSFAVVLSDRKSYFNLFVPGIVVFADFAVNRHEPNRENKSGLKAGHSSAPREYLFFKFLLLFFLWFFREVVTNFPLKRFVYFLSRLTEFTFNRTNSRNEYLNKHTI